MSLLVCHGALCLPLPSLHDSDFYEIFLLLVEIKICNNVLSQLTDDNHVETVRYIFVSLITLPCCFAYQIAGKKLKFIYGHLPQVILKYIYIAVQ